jgi:hypothetical protein
MSSKFVLGTLLVAASLAPVAMAHDEVIPVEQYYIVINEEEGTIEIWQEANGHAGLQQEPFDCVFHPEKGHIICQPPDVMLSRLPDDLGL